MTVDELRIENEELRTSLEMMDEFRLHLEADNARLREALKAAQDQFQFYADEHRSAGKTEKAQTNQAMADRCDAALQPNLKEDDND